MRGWMESILYKQLLLGDMYCWVHFAQLLALLPVASEHNFFTYNMLTLSLKKKGEQQDTVEILNSENGGS